MDAGEPEGLPPLGQAEFRPLGRHRLAIDEDLVWLVPLGGLDLAETRQLMDLVYGVTDHYGYVLVLVDGRQAKPATPESRRYQMERLKQRIQPSHSAVYGANYLVITLLNLMYRAVELLTGKQTPHSFHKDEASARARLAAERTRLRAENDRAAPIAANRAPRE